MTKFLSTHAPSGHGATAPVAAGGQQRIPAKLRVLSAHLDGKRYADGFFQFIAGGSFDPFLSLWNLDPADCYTFLKCGFGHLVFFHRKQFKTLNPVLNRIDVLGDEEDADFVLDIVLCDRPILEKSFFIDVYEQAFPHLGSPEPDEMYAFVPALGLGGPRDSEQVEKLKMKVEMTTLARL